MSDCLGAVGDKAKVCEKPAEHSDLLRSFADSKSDCRMYFQYATHIHCDYFKNFPYPYISSSNTNLP